MGLTRKGTQQENSRNIIIGKEWFLSLNNVLNSFFGSETVASLFFEHGRNVGRTFFHEIREPVQNQRNSSQVYLNTFYDWLRRSGFGTVEITNYESTKKCECRITNYLEEVDNSYYCGLLTGLLECVWGKKIAINCSQDFSRNLLKVVLQDDL